VTAADKSVGELQSALAESQASSETDKVTIEDLKQQIDDLLDKQEAELAKLEAEGLQPLVDRQRTHIRIIKTLMTAAFAAVGELTTEPSAK
jgi:hypothetical protein